MYMIRKKNIVVHEMVEGNHRCQNQLTYFSGRLILQLSLSELIIWMSTVNADNTNMRVTTH